MFLTACVGIKVRHLTENVRQGAGGGGVGGGRDARETRKPETGSKKKGQQREKKREMGRGWGAREVREARRPFWNLPSIFQHRLTQI